VAAGIIVSLGHADASAEQASEALEAGATVFTHLFNAMSQLESRAPGMVGAALADPACFCSLIVDGQHVHDAALKVALAAKGTDRLVLITDAMSSAAGGPDRFLLQGRAVALRNGRLELDNGTLAGSNLTMDAAVRNCVRRLGVPLARALRMASLNPAAALRLDDRLGRLAPGYLASLVHLSEELEVLATWIEGE
jgi:N-acetylglucosamine-6-phosphate deacetylase